MKELSIAIVDDNPMVLNTLEGILGQEKDMSVIGKAENGEDALHMITDKSPDVVLLDLIMPKIDGISVVERIKQSESLKKIPAFIILSSVAGEQMAEEAFRAGANNPFRGQGNLLRRRRGKRDVSRTWRHIWRNIWRPILRKCFTNWEFRPILRDTNI